MCLEPVPPKSWLFQNGPPVPSSDGGLSPITEKSARPPHGTATAGKVSRGFQSHVDALGSRVSVFPTPTHSPLGGGAAPPSAVDNRGGWGAQDKQRSRAVGPDLEKQIVTIKRKGCVAKQHGARPRVLLGAVLMPGSC